MKKGLLLALAVMSVSTAFAQQTKKFNPATAYKAGKFTAQEERKMALRNPQSATSRNTNTGIGVSRPQLRTSALGTVTQLGRASNAYGVLRTSQNIVFANNATNTIGFIHRQSNEDWGGTPPAVANGQIRLDFSKDEGANWDLDMGPFNPIPNQANGRYPQAAVHVPAGETDFCNSFVGWQVALTDGSGWGNYSYGLAKGFGQSGTQQASFCNGATESTEDYTSTAQDQMVLIPGGFVNGPNNTFWFIDNFYDPAAEISSDSLQIWKGQINTSTGTVSWAKHVTLNQSPSMPAYLDANGDANIGVTNMAFSPDGRVAWAATAIDPEDGTCDSLSFPVLWSSHDYGETWSGPYMVNFKNYQVIKDTLRLIDPTSGQQVNLDLPQVSSSGSFDIEVDKDGNPHLFIGALNAYADACTNPDSARFIATGAVAFFDITCTNCGQPGGNYNWDPKFIAYTNQWRGDNGSGTDQISWINNPQIARDETGQYLFYSWTDDTTSSATNNNNPNLWITARNIYGTTVPPRCPSEGDPDWDNKVFYPNIPPVILTKDDGNMHVPIVFTEIKTSPVEEVQFWYINGPQNSFTMQELDALVSSEKVSFAPSVKLYPNPTSNQLNVEITSAVPSDAVIEVVDIQGRTVMTRKAANLQNETVSVDLSALSGGLYVVKVTTAGGSTSQKITKN